MENFPCAQGILADGRDVRDNSERRAHSRSLPVSASHLAPLLRPAIWRQEQPICPHGPYTHCQLPTWLKKHPILPPGPPQLAATTPPPRSKRLQPPFFFFLMRRSAPTTPARAATAAPRPPATTRSRRRPSRWAAPPAPRPTRLDQNPHCLIFVSAQFKASSTFLYILVFVLLGFLVAGGGVVWVPARGPPPLLLHLVKPRRLPTRPSSFP